jgi:hypothetical protein
LPDSGKRDHESNAEKSDQTFKTNYTPTVPKGFLF